MRRQQRAPAHALAAPPLAAADGRTTASPLLCLPRPAATSSATTSCTAPGPRRPCLTALRSWSAWRSCEWQAPPRACTVHHASASARRPRCWLPLPCILTSARPCPPAHPPQAPERQPLPWRAARRLGCSRRLPAPAGAVNCVWPAQRHAAGQLGPAGRVPRPQSAAPGPEPAAWPPATAVGRPGGLPLAGAPVSAAVLPADVASALTCTAAATPPTPSNSGRPARVHASPSPEQPERFHCACAGAGSWRTTSSAAPCLPTGAAAPPSPSCESWACPTAAWVASCRPAGAQTAALSLSLT